MAGVNIKEGVYEDKAISEDKLWKTLPMKLTNRPFHYWMPKYSLSN